jgi:hypothetical protein
VIVLLLLMMLAIELLQLLLLLLLLLPSGCGKTRALRTSEARISLCGTL